MGQCSRWWRRLIGAGLGLIMGAACAQPAPPAFPGAEGFGAVATGGRGGVVLQVTSLAPDPAGLEVGTLNWALRQAGPRYILFKVSGVIHAAGNIVHGDVTLAGQTSPGGVIVRGLVCDGHYERNDCSNLIVRHLRLRPGWNLSLPPGGERLDDALRLDGVQRFIFDHVDMATAADEAVQLSWASQGTIQYSALGETVGDHADRGGMLLNYSHPDFPQDQLSIHHNLWFRVGGRLPELTCEASNYDGLPGLNASCQSTPLQLELSANRYYDVDFPLYYNRDVDQNAALGPYRLRLNLVDNQFTVRSSFPYGIAISDLLAVADNQLHFSGNRLNLYPDFSDYQLLWCCNDFPSNVPNADLGVALRRSTRHPFPPIGQLGQGVSPPWLATVGAQPADPMLRRWSTRVTSGGFDPQPFSQPGADDAHALDFDPGNPPASPADRDQDGMPDSFELQYAGLGLDPDVDDHLGQQLSLPLTGVGGYDNLEVYLNLLSDARVGVGDVVLRNGFE